MSSLEQKAKELAERKLAQQSVDWNAERDWWLERLRELYQDVKSWLQPLVDAGQLDVSEPSLTLEEHSIGSYEANRLVLDFSGEAVILDPQGTLLVGSRGRVDAFRRGRRPRQPVMLILEGTKDSPTWAIWPTRDPRQRKDLTEESFKDLVSTLL